MMNNDDLIATLTPIFDKVEGDWTYDENANPARSSDGMRLYANVSTYGAKVGRLELSAGVPREADYSSGDYSGLDRPEITVDPTRDPVALARDIERRLLPKAVEYWNTVTGRIERRLAALNAREVASHQMAEVMGGQARQHRTSDWMVELPDEFRKWSSYCYGDFKPNNDGSYFTVEIHNLPTERAHELAALIKSWI